MENWQAKQRIQSQADSLIFTVHEFTVTRMDSKQPHNCLTDVQDLQPPILVLKKH